MDDKNILEETIERYVEHLNSTTPGSDEALKITEELEKLYKLRNEQYKYESESYSALEKIRVDEEVKKAEIEEVKRSNDLKETELKQRKGKDIADTICSVLGTVAKVGVGVLSLGVTVMLTDKTMGFEEDNVWTTAAKVWIPKILPIGKD